MEAESFVQAETVFAGYGVIAEDFGYNDYANLDVKGKIVVVLTGRPDDLPSEEGAHIGSGGEKIRHAVERGAVGFITLHTPKRNKVRDFSVSARYASAPRMTWVGPDGKAHGTYAEIKGGAYVSHEKAAPLFVGAAEVVRKCFCS